MRIAFNALSVTHLSARHVLRGHMREILANSKDRHLLLFHKSNRDLAEYFGTCLDCIECPSITSLWPGRSLWEYFYLEKLLQEQRVDLLFSPAGHSVSGLTIPQAILTQNPWCFVSSIQTSKGERLKAALQRRAYRRAQRKAAIMLYNSQYMKNLYDVNAGFSATTSCILYQGIDDTAFIAGSKFLNFYQRKPEILVVSAMASHKSVEDVIVALSLLRKSGVDAQLRLVGPWPNIGYRKKIEGLIDGLSLSSSVVISGMVNQQTLFEAYRTAKVFCLLSRCESFGIPAVEAQAFSTPTVVSNCGALPEVAGPGGVVVPAGDPKAAAEALLPLFQSEQHWFSASKRARANADRFRWNQCTKTLIAYLESCSDNQNGPSGNEGILIGHDC